jgi:hypothetical protein
VQRSPKKARGKTQQQATSKMNFLLGADKEKEVLSEAERRRAEARKDQQPLNLQKQLCR